MEYDAIAGEVYDLADYIQRYSKPELGRTSSMSTDAHAELVVRMLDEVLAIADAEAVELEEMLSFIDEIEVDSVRNAFLRHLEPHRKELHNAIAVAQEHQRYLDDWIAAGVPASELPALHSAALRGTQAAEDLESLTGLRMEEVLQQASGAAQKAWKKIRKKNQERLFERVHPEAHKQIIALKIAGELTGQAASAVGIPLVGQVFKLAQYLVKKNAMAGDDVEEFLDLLSESGPSF